MSIKMFTNECLNLPFSCKKEKNRIYFTALYTILSHENFNKIIQSIWIISGKPII